MIKKRNLTKSAKTEIWVRLRRESCVPVSGCGSFRPEVLTMNAYSLSSSFDSFIDGQTHSEISKGSFCECACQMHTVYSAKRLRFFFLILSISMPLS